MNFKITDELLKDFKFNIFAEIGLDITNTFRKYSTKNPKYNPWRDFLLPWNGTENCFKGLVYLLTFLGSLALIATIVYPLWEIYSAPKQEKFTKLLELAQFPIANLFLGVKFLLYGLTQLTAFATGLSVLKTTIRTFITWNIPSEIPLIQKSREIFKNISKDFRNVFKAYKSQIYFTNDLFQIFDGIYNFAAGSLLLVLSILNLIFSCTLIIPVGMFLISLTDNYKETFKERMADALKAAAYFPYSTFLTFSLGASYFFRGLTEIISYLTLLTLLKSCVRQLITWWRYDNGYQPIQENSDIQELVTKIKNERGSFTDINEIMKSKEIIEFASELSIKLSKYETKGQLMNGYSFSHPIMSIHIEKEHNQTKTYTTRWTQGLTIQAFDDCLEHYSNTLSK